MSGGTVGGMILVTGAGGQVGRQIAELLAKRGAAVRRMARDPSRLPTLSGTEVAKADYANARELDAAFAGIETAFIVSGSAPEGVRAGLHGNAIDAAVRQGVKHVVYLSFQGASPLSKFPMGRDHFLTEQHLAACGISHTALRDNLYLDALVEMFDSDGVVRGPAGAGPAAWVSREDVAELAAAILLDPSLGGGSLDVSGPEAFGFAEGAERLSKLAGRRLRYVDETLDEARGWREATGAPAWEVETWIGSYLAMEAGELAGTSPTIERVLGRKPQSLEEYFGRHPELLVALRGDERKISP